MPQILRLRTGPKLAAGGDAVARAPDGRVVFVSGAAPDETADVEIEEVNPTFARGRAVHIVTPGSTRVSPPCPYFERCGGCTLQHVAVAQQTRSKHEAVLETLARIGKVDLAHVTLSEPWAGASEGYRLRARFAIDGARRAAGFRARRSREVVDIDTCLVLAPALQRALDRVRAALSRFAEPLPAEEELEAIAAGDRALVALPRKLEPLRAAFSEDEAVRLARDKKDALEIEDAAGRLLLAPSVFAQANAGGNFAMVEEVERLLRGTAAEGGEVLELYAGSGNFTRVLARLAGNVRALEGSVAAAALARRVLPANVEVRSDPIERALARLAGSGWSPDAIVLDPPRSGVSPQVIAAIAALRPRLLVYVSCDPATFARDLSRLRESCGVALDHLRVFDLYPHTAHVEVIGRLGPERKEKKKP